MVHGNPPFVLTDSSVGPFSWDRSLVCMINNTCVAGKMGAQGPGDGPFQLCMGRRLLRVQAPHRRLANGVSAVRRDLPVISVAPLQRARTRLGSPTGASLRAAG